jgi:acyl-CoA reductase-like NAD-dependent aldehyde dehydrogenase
MKHSNEIFVDGRWRAVPGAASLEVVNPFTEEVIGAVAACGVDEVERAVQAAGRSLAAWQATPVARRVELLQALHRGMSSRSAELATLIASEVGMPRRMSERIQVGLPLGTLAGAAAMLQDFRFEEKRGNSVIVREPIGVVACITPWNYPLHQVMSKVAPALAAGCAVVLKPSEVAPMTAFVLAEEIEAAGFPAGVFNLVTGLGPAAGEALVDHPGVDMVSFTGSTAAGRRILVVAARTVKRVALELGGKSAAVVLDDADLAVAVKATVNNCFLNAGQTCSALSRLLVPAARHDEAAALAVAAAQGFAPGDPMNDRTKLGPLASAAQRERVTGHIRRAQADGAQLLCGGSDRPTDTPKGFFVQPTVLGQVDPKSAVAQEEVFGPVLCVIAYANEEEAIAIANGTPYGLAAAVWSGSEDRAQRVARRLQAGQVDVNGGPFNPQAPFGGYKQSGNGREGGREGFEEFLETKAMQFRTA